MRRQVLQLQHHAPAYRAHTQMTPPIPIPRELLERLTAKAKELFLEYAWSTLPGPGETELNQLIADIRAAEALLAPKPVANQAYQVCEGVPSASRPTIHQITEANQRTNLEDELTDARAAEELLAKDDFNPASIIGNLNKSNGHRPECCCAQCGPPSMNPPVHRITADEHKELCDWAESIICNAYPMDHCTQEEWNELVRSWRDKKHAIFSDSPTAPQPPREDAI